MISKRLFSKKSQLQIVFAFILMTLIAGLVIVMGYKFISKWSSGINDVELLEFGKTLDNYVNKYNTFGDYNPEKIMAPNKVQAVCFISAEAFESGGLTSRDIKSNNYQSVNPILLDAVNHPESQPSNVYVIDQDKNVLPLNNLFLKKLSLKDKDIVCVEAKGGYFHLGFNGLGKTTQIVDESN